MNWTQLTTETIKNLSMTGAILVGAAIFRLVAELVIKAMVKRFGDELSEKGPTYERRVQTISSIIKNALNIFIFVVTVLTVMSQWGIDIAPLLTGAGILGLAVGFGSQRLVQDIVTGFFILLENSFNVGDLVEIAGKKGKVIKMNLRTTLLVGDDGSIHTVPNSQIGTIQKLLIDGESQE